MNPRRRQGLLLVLLLTTVTAACTSPAGEGAATTSSSTVTTVPGTIATTTVPAGPGGPFAAEPEPPLGAPLNFNESGGCGVAQGVRGPYASFVGNLEDGEAIRGPWGDFFGRDFAEVRQHLVAVTLPMTGDEVVSVWVHEGVRPALEHAIANLEREEAAGRYYEIRAAETSSFNPATVSPKRYLSFHAVGAAIDINSAANPFSGDNVLVTDMPEWFVKAWTDAGWCWGGGWQTIKDPMHFSWQGPLFTPGYPVTAPVPARSDEAPFRHSLAFATALGPVPDGATLAVADLDRDGAPDVVRLRPWTAEGGFGVEIAQAMYAFAGSCIPLVTSPIADGATLLMADGDGDARPDLWEVGASGEQVSVTIHTQATGFSQKLRPRETGIAASPGAAFLAGDFDRDGFGDLFVLAGGTLEVWAGPLFDRLPAEADLPAPLGEGWRFALGDHDLDGVPDLFALSPDDPALLVVLAGGTGYGGEPRTITTAVSGHEGTFGVGDLDGDGRPDLYLLDADGSLTVYLGGDRSGVSDEGLTYWFVEGHDQPTTRQEACPVVP
jgi:hypothetical protein